jgi:hypothetical protein
MPQVREVHIARCGGWIVVDVVAQRGNGVVDGGFVAALQRLEERRDVVVESAVATAP